MDNFLFEYQTKVYFGKGTAREHLADAVSKYGKNVMLAYGGGSVKVSGIYDEILEILERAGMNVTEFSGIMSNPTYKKVQEGATLAKSAQIDFILAVGGGSVIDCCKIIAAQAKTDEDLWKMELEEGKALTTVPIPMGAVVTASGTGAEMNGGAVITNEEIHMKTGLFSAPPRFAVLDPEYTMTVPAAQVISGAFDTLSHAMETYFGQSDRDNVSDYVAEAVMKNTIQNIRTLLRDISDYTARSNLMWDSAMAENGILKVGRKTDFEVHQIEHQLGAYTDCNHGQGLAVLQPVYYRHIYKAAVPKFVRFADSVWGISSKYLSEEEQALAGIKALEDFIQECGLPTRLSQLRMKDEAKKLLTPVTLKTIADSCNITRGGYKPLTHEEIHVILLECL